MNVRCEAVGLECIWHTHTAPGRSRASAEGRGTAKYMHSAADGHLHLTQRLLQHLQSPSRVTGARGRPLPHRTAPDPPNLPRTNTICAAPSRAASTPAALVCLQSVSAGSSPLLSPRERRPRGVIRMRVDPHDLELSSRRWLGSSKARVRQDGQTRIWAESFDPGTCREVVGRAGDSHWAQSCHAARSASTTLRACARLSTPHSNWAQNADSVRRL